jgi:hypothetical protein
MAFRKRTSLVLEKAQKRADGIKAITTPLSLGGVLTLKDYQDKMAAVQAKLSAYNTALAEADHINDDLVALEKELSDLSERMLTGIASQFGKDSPEYELAGGVRRSERKKPARKAKA